MVQKLLLAGAALLIVAAIGIGAVGAAQSARTAGWFGGMHGNGGNGGGMIGRSYGPGGMMGGGYPASLPAGAQPISIDQAQQQVEQYLARAGSTDLVLDELIEFQDNYYAIVKEKSTGVGAFELLVNPVTGAVSREPGPDMMWNTKYGPMAGGMMGILRQPGAMTVTADRASQIAQSWLDANFAGASVETPDAFYGYYTVHFTQGGHVAGMLSVNGYTGEVWYHTWHGAFIEEKEVSS